MELRHLVDLGDIETGKIMDILTTAGAIMKNPGYYSDSCHAKVMATLFYEPSTRTRMSFEAAMLRLGGSVIGFNDPQNSSVSKGESLKDTITMVGNYADIIAMRHYSEGAAKAASIFSRVPVINAGDGGHLHPTQTLTDIFTLTQTKGRLDDLTIGLCGDLKYGRTVHSLIKTMSRFKNNSFVLISTPELSVPDYIKTFMDEHGCEYRQADSLEAEIGGLDVLYMTRIQRERFKSEEEYERQKGVFILDGEKMKKAKKDMAVLHPLPRVDEITYDVDDDPRALYFRQSEYGLYARMSLILHILENGEKRLDARPQQNTEKCCGNLKCITHSEAYLPHLEEDGNCAYCESRLL